MQVQGIMRWFCLFSASALVISCGGSIELQPPASDQTLTAVTQQLQAAPSSGYGLEAIVLENLATLRTDAWSAHQSSFDRAGGNGDTGNFLYINAGGEQVLLDVDGPGCVYRMWFTGQPGDAWLKIYFDGESTPRLNAYLSDLTSGTYAGFPSPLVGNNTVSSGGFYIDVPLPFQSSIQITSNSAGSHYYNIDYHSFPFGTEIATWTGSEDVAAAHLAWSLAGIADPKPDAGNTVVSGNINIAAGRTQTLANLTGSRSISAVKLILNGVAVDKVPPVLDDGRAFVGYSQFNVVVSPTNSGVTLVRRLDYGIPNQQATVSVDGALVGTWSTPGSNATDRWLDSSFSIPSTYTAGKSSITVTITFVSSDLDWNEFYYWAFSSSATGAVTVDQIDIGNTTSESNHNYVIGSQTWNSSNYFTYPTPATDNGRAHKGSSQFTLALDSANQGAVLWRRLDYGVGNQRASVYIDDTYVGEWAKPGSDATNHWRDHAFVIPASFTQGKSSVKVTVTFVSADIDWNEFYYWMYSNVNGHDLLTDRLDVGDTLSEQFHGYTITTQNWSGTRTFTYPTDTYASQLNDVSLRISWDNETTPSISAPLGHLFGLGRLGAAELRGLAFGMDASGMMYLYYPMPFQSRARIQLVNGTSSRIAGTWEVRHRPFSGDFSQVGRLKAAYNISTPAAGSDVALLDTDGAGQVVGVVQSVTGASGVGRGYLEGDEHVKIDATGTASFNVQGTGTEDFYNGGWYFQYDTFTLPTHGNPVHVGGNPDSTSMYRQFIGDAFPFRSHIRFTIEHGSVNDVSETCWSLVYYYLAAAAKLPTSPDDTLNVGDATSEANHAYAISGQTWTSSQTFQYEAEGYPTETRSGRAHRGSSEFNLAIQPSNQGVVLRRLFDQGIGSQRAQVFVDGVLVGTFYKAGTNSTLRWRTEDFVIPASFTAGKSSIRVRLQFVSSNYDWNEFQYQTFSLL